MRTMTAVPSILEQALQLDVAERGRLIAQLLDSLDATDEDVLDGEAWQAAWSTELLRRVREVEDGTAALIDGDEALARVRARVAARRR